MVHNNTASVSIWSAAVFLGDEDRHKQKGKRSGRCIVVCKCSGVVRDELDNELKGEIC